MPSFPVAGFSRPSPSQPRSFRLRCRGVGLPTQCPASPLPKLHAVRSPLWRCSSSAFGTNFSASGLKKKPSPPPHADDSQPTKLRRVPLYRGWGSYGHRWTAVGPDGPRLTPRSEQAKATQESAVAPIYLLGLQAPNNATPRPHPNAPPRIGCVVNGQMTKTTNK